MSRAGGGRGAADGQRLRRDLLRYLRIRERTVQELTAYLERRGHAAEEIECAVAEAREQGFVDDGRFAEIFLRDRRRLRPMSRSAVLLELRKRGVAAETARAALTACDPPWEDEQLAWEAAVRRWERWPTGGRREKAARFLQRRGFTAAIAARVLARLDRADAGGRAQALASREDSDAGADRWHEDQDW
jgi:regulatory protein